MVLIYWKYEINKLLQLRMIFKNLLKIFSIKSVVCLAQGLKLKLLWGPN